MIAHTQVGWESYDNVVYLERTLRPKILSLTGSADEDSEEAPLGYETYKKNLRGKGPKWWEVPVPIVSAALLVGGTFLFGCYYRWTAVEWFAVPISLGLDRGYKGNV